MHKEYEEEESKLADKLSQYRKSLKTGDSGYTLPSEPIKPVMPDCMYEELVLDTLSYEMDEGLTPSEISEKLGISTPKVSKLLQELVTKGYVSRYMDKRRVYYYVTDEYYNR